MPYWLKIKVLGHLKITNRTGVNIHRDYSRGIVVIDYFGGPCIKYSYDGKWLCG